MFDYKLIEAFAMVITEGGFEKAAKVLHLTQSAVSQRVKQLEDEYGRLLVQRITPPQATSAGAPLLTHYRRVKQLEEDLLHARGKTKTPSFSTLSIAINADSLATWFFAAVRPLLEKERIVLDLHVDDQDRTHDLMQQGKVWGCLSTRRAPLQGCKATLLGSMAYGLFAAPPFSEKWFPEGLTHEACEKAPMARFNRKDDLNQRMFRLLFRKQIKTPPTFFVPSSEIYAAFVAKGLCHGMLPEQQSRPLEESGAIVNLSPSNSVKVDLYWHCWQLRSHLMESFNKAFIRNADAVLRVKA